MRRQNTRLGFTIIELVIVIAIGVLLLGLTMPTGIEFYRGVLAQDVTDEISTVLRKASDEARLGKNDIAHGIFFGSTTMTYFQGQTYNTRVTSADEVIALPAMTNISGFGPEIIFAKHTGVPSATGTLVVYLYGNRHTLSISTLGTIWEIE